MFLRLYIAKRIGDGLTLDTRFRSILNEYVRIHDGEYFLEADVPTKSKSICLCIASEGTHTDIYNHRAVSPDDIIYLTPSVEVEAVALLLNQRFDSLPQQFRDTAWAYLRGIGLAKDSMDADATIGGYVRYILKHVLSKQAEELGSVFSGEGSLRWGALTL